MTTAPAFRRLLLIPALLALAPCLATPSFAAGDDGEPYHVTVRRDAWGVAHIKADDFGSLGYGEGYAAAQDHVCNIAFELLRARGEMARFLGPGDADANVASDAVVAALDIGAQARAALASQDASLRAWVRGYSDGFNRYLAAHRDGGNGSWCGDADWLRATTAEDFMARMVLLALTLPRLSPALAAAQPPEAAATAARALPPEDLLAEAALVGMGSNAWALGSERTENGRGVLLANPHYPWYGGNRFWEKHLTVPGQLDIYGVHLLGAPGVAIGFNQHLGWSHTVSASQRLVVYRLQLDPANPLRYRHGDGWREIEARPVTVAVRGEDGKLSTQSLTLYFSHHGPLLAMPNMAWGDGFAYAARDANTGNYALLQQWKAMGEATDLDAFIAAHARYNAMPWVNTIAASATGRALYLDDSSVGNLSGAAQARWRESLQHDPLAAGLFRDRGMVLLDGADPDNDWIVDPDAPLPGTVPFAARPRIERRDYVFNANDSYWLSNASAPLDGYSVLYGPTETARSLRTRMNVQLLQNRYGDAGEDGRYSYREVQAALFANRGMAAELLREELAAACAAAVDLAEACEVLAAYDGTLNLDSAGAVLFREWITRFEASATQGDGTLFGEAFDPARPVATPRGLADPDNALEALRSAVKVLTEARLPLDSTLRTTQFAWRAGEAIPVHGGNTHEGVANLQVSGDPSASPIAGVQPKPVADSRYLTSAGYPVVHGSSFILTLAFDDDGPIAEALLSYGQSGAPGAPHFADQTRLYADKRWRRIAFTAAEVDTAARSILVLRGDDRSG